MGHLSPCTDTQPNSLVLLMESSTQHKMQPLCSLMDTRWVFKHLCIFSWLSVAEPLFRGALCFPPSHNSGFSKLAPLCLCPWLGACRMKWQRE